MWKVKVTTGWCSPRKKRWYLLRPLGQCGWVWKKILLPLPHFEPPPPKSKYWNRIVISTLCKMYGQNFDVAFTIERTAWKIQNNVESVYKFPIWSSIEETHKLNSLWICPDIYCYPVSTAAFKYAKPNNNYYNVCFFILETRRKLSQRTLLYLSLWMKCNQSEWHKDITGEFTFLIPAEFYLVSFVRPYPTTLRNFKQNF
jgi:hypothetical protein